MPNSDKPNNAVFLETLDRYVPEVLMTMVSIQATPGAGDLQAPQPSNLTGVTGAIGLSGKINGVVYTAFSEGLAKYVAEKILGGAASDQDVADVVAELTNMITGNLKSRLCDMGFNCALSIPSVVRGDEINVSAKNASISIRNSYAVEGSTDPLVVQVFAAVEG